MSYLHLSTEYLLRLMHRMSIHDAAKKHNVTITKFRKLCRTRGIHHWTPFNGYKSRKTNRIYNSFSKRRPHTSPGYTIRLKLETRLKPLNLQNNFVNCSFETANDKLLRDIYLDKNIQLDEILKEFDYEKIEKTFKHFYK